jgi:6-pyruvoyltetrahydropterin/6-carboxytetrahydropterin synthase
MFRLEKDFRFEAAHRLCHHNGKCARLHGHSFKGTLVCIGTDDDIHQEWGPHHGMLIDFDDMKVGCKTIEDALDHQYLNDVLQTESPTSEYIAKWVFDHVRELLPSLYSVTIEETCSARCTYVGEPNDATQHSAIREPNSRRHGHRGQRPIPDHTG